MMIKRILYMFVVLMSAAVLFSTAVADTDAFSGEWVDTYSERARMNIHSDGEGGYHVLITWASSAFERSEWHMTAVPLTEEAAGDGCTLISEDCVRVEWKVDEHGSETRMTAHEGGKAKLVLAQGQILWRDENENAGELCTFVRQTEDVYSGRWYDSVSQRAFMDIAFDGQVYDIEIQWSSSAFEYTRWHMTAVRSTEGERISLIAEDCVRFDCMVDENAQERQTVVYAQGKARLDDLDGVFCWTDEQDDTGTECRFVRDCDGCAV